MAGNSSIGLLAAFLAMTAPLGLLGLMVPLALLWSSYDQQTRRSQEARLFAELAAGQERATARSSRHLRAGRRHGRRPAVRGRRRRDGAARRGRPGALRRRRGRRAAAACASTPTSSTSRGSCAPSVPGASAPASRTAGPGARPSSASPTARRPCCSPAGPVGVGPVRPPRDAAGRGPRRPGRGWLSVADLSTRPHRRRAGGGRRQRRAGPRRHRCRHRAGAEGPAASPPTGSPGWPQSQGGVDDIVEELHLVERAVASLLGAVALAADPELARQRRDALRPDGAPRGDRLDHDRRPAVTSRRPGCRSPFWVALLGAGRAHRSSGRRLSSCWSTASGSTRRSSRAWSPGRSPGLADRPGRRRRRHPARRRAADPARGCRAPAGRAGLPVQTSRRLVTRRPLEVAELAGPWTPCTCGCGWPTTSASGTGARPRRPVPGSSSCCPAWSPQRRARAGSSPQSCTTPSPSR